MKSKVAEETGFAEDEIALKLGWDYNEYSA